MTTETKPDHEIAREELEALFKETVKHEIHITGPVPLVKDDWPCMHYYVNIAGQTFELSTGITGPVPSVKDDWPCMHYYVNIAGQTFELSTGITGPVPSVKDDWPCMHYYVNIAGQTFELSTGIGHAKMERFNGKEYTCAAMFKLLVSTDEQNALRHINLGRTLADKQITARVACKVGRDVKPDPAEVVASACREYMDTQDAGDFEEWASNLGYDTDSRKAKQIYRQCVDGLGKLKRIGLTMAQIKQFAELSARL